MGTLTLAKVDDIFDLYYAEDEDDGWLRVDAPTMVEVNGDETTAVFWIGSDDRYHLQSLVARNGYSIPKRPRVGTLVRPLLDHIKPFITVTRQTPSEHTTSWGYIEDAADYFVARALWRNKYQAIMDRRGCSYDTAAQRISRARRAGYVWGD